MEETNMEKNIDIAENDAKQYIVVKIGSEQYISLTSSNVYFVIYFLQLFLHNKHSETL